MAKFGKKNVIKTNIWDYNIGLLGESGIGKSTLIFQVLDKLVGDEGYLALDIGKEDGHDSINGINTEKVEDTEKLIAVWKDILENKKEDYPELKVIVYDTLDQLIEIVEPYITAKYNKEAKKQGKESADSINAAYGGFMRGQDAVVEFIQNKLWELKKIGVSFILIGHTKNKESVDAITEQSYKQLTSNITERYFNAFKTKLHFLGVACIDRAISLENTGRKDFKKKDIKVSRIQDERRVIKFRDDNYSVASKSRFSNITDQIMLDRDEFIDALNDAIMTEYSKGNNKTPFKEQQKVDQKEKEEKANDFINQKQEEENITNEINEVREKVLTILRNKEAMTNEMKISLAKAMKENGVSKDIEFTSIEQAKAILDSLTK